MGLTLAADTLGRIMLATADYPTPSVAPLCVRAVLEQGLLRAVFQPVVSLADTVVYAHEGLIRGPAHTVLETPDALLLHAAREGCLQQLEVACVRTILLQWRRLSQPGRLFVNLSAAALTHLLQARGADVLLDFLKSCAMPPRNLVLELTEHERVQDMDAFADVAAQVQACGVALALDDFGDGRSSLRLWSQIKPYVVKIDKYFTRDISVHADKLKTLQALQQIAEVFDTTLVAEGIESEADLRALRDLGIALGQGYYLGKPAPIPLEHPNAQTLMVLQDSRIAVLPNHARRQLRNALQSLSFVAAPTVTRTTSNDALAQLFARFDNLHAVAVVEGNRPIGIINRFRFINEYAKLYYREVWGRKSCAAHINDAPRLIERSHNIDELVGILTSQDQRYLHDGFIVTENGRYLGVGRGEELVRSVTESRVEAARHANPLTFLPGNIPISQHMQRLLDKDAAFVACYADLNHFKQFNDRYGYWRGDEMIRLMARLAEQACNPQRDFLGHVGGDDFILLYQSSDWRERCTGLIADFANQARLLFDPQAQALGGIFVEDRYGVERLIPCTTVSIGAVMVEPGEFRSSEEVANAAAAAKARAKHHGESTLWVQEPSNADLTPAEACAATPTPWVNT